MSRARDAARFEAELQVAARRSSPAHRGLRKRAAAREMPDAVAEPTLEAEAITAPVPEVVEPEFVEPEVVEPEVVEPEVAEPEQPEPQPDDTVVLEPLVAAAALEPDAAPARISPYEVEATPSDPTPTEAFAIAMGAAGPKKRRHWVTWVVILAIVLVGYAALAFFLRNTVPEGTSIAGVSAGTTVESATETATELAALAAATDVTLTAGDNSTPLDPQEAGLAVDVDATVASAGGFTLNPITLWHRLTGEGADHALAVTVDEAAFDAAVDAAANELDSTAANASITIEGTEAVVTPGTQTVEVDREAAGDDILAVWPTLQTVEVTAEVEDPAVPTAEAAARAATLNAHVFAGPTTLTGDNGNVLLPAALVAENSTVTEVDGNLVWQVDGAPIAAFMLDTYPKLENEPVDASYRFTKAHKLKVTEGEPGRELHVESVDEAVVAAAGTSARTGPIPYLEEEPEVTAEELPTQDFETRVSHFRTPLTNEPIRTRNLVRSAQLVTGTIVKPGERFNLTDTIGPITAANGYYDAHVIVNGVLTTGIGGGLSQMATTTYNAGYFAGYDDIEHRPHSVWFPRYPAGRESTVLNGSINVVFENTTPYAMIMNSYVEDGYLNVDIWSTKYYTVKTEASDKTNFTQPSVIEVDSDDCEAKGPGQPGFKITNTRWVYHDDELVEKRSWTWTYRPDHAIRCVG